MNIGSNNTFSNRFLKTVLAIILIPDNHKSDYYMNDYSDYENVDYDYSAFGTVESAYLEQASSIYGFKILIECILKH